MSTEQIYLVLATPRPSGASVGRSTWLHSTSDGGRSTRNAKGDSDTLALIRRFRAGRTDGVSHLLAPRSARPPEAKHHAKGRVIDSRGVLLSRTNTIDAAYDKTVELGL